MSKQVYISADYSEDSGDRNVVNTLNGWSKDNLHSIEFVDMAKVVSGSVAEKSDCYPCDLKNEFNNQINASSAVIFVVGDKTATRTAGSNCSRATTGYIHLCTPYKQNTNGIKLCNKSYVNNYYNDNVEKINNYSYLRHEFEQAKKKNKNIIIVFNSTRMEKNWIPSYMKGYENNMFPFWTSDINGNKIGNYYAVKEALGYD